MADKKPVPRHVLDTRAANKIMNILKDEPITARQRILSFVISAITDVELPQAQSITDPRQHPLPYAQAPGETHAVGYVGSTPTAR
jgi:hypothetical protein